MMHNMTIPKSSASLRCKNSRWNSTDSFDCEYSQCPLNDALHDAILTENSTTIMDILKIRSANSPLHPPAGFYGNVQLQCPPNLPIHLAAAHRKVQSLESLLLSNADPDIRDKHGHTPLHLLITHWPRMNSSWLKPSTKFEHAMAAIQHRAEACLRLLCSSGADLNAYLENDRQHTALHLAVRYGATPAIGILASHGADVNASDRFGVLPLHMAAGTLNPAMIAELIQHRANVNKAVHQSGATALDLAATAITVKDCKSLPVDLTCITKLLAGGASPDIQNKAGWTPLHTACQGGAEKVVDLLLKYGAQVNICTNLGENCLFVFLDRKANLQCASLLGKLLSLTYPLAITNNQGVLPSSLLLPEYRSLRDTLLQLSRQPLDLQSICRVHIRRQHEDRFTQNLKDMLPEKLSKFVYSDWNLLSGITLSGTCHKANSEMPEDLTRTFEDVNIVE